MQTFSVVKNCLQSKSYIVQFPICRISICFAAAAKKKPVNLMDIKLPLMSGPPRFGAARFGPGPVGPGMSGPMMVLMSDF